LEAKKTKLAMGNRPYKSKTGKTFINPIEMKFVLNSAGHLNDKKLIERTGTG